jgi:DNA-binding FadR family transcriptional regulator
VHATSPRPREPQRTVHFDTIKEPKAAQRVAERVRSAIRNGELRNGDRLPPERQLIQEFGYSRAIVREALRMLEDEGLITLHAGRNGGAIIRHPGTERLMNAFDMLLRLRQTSQADFYEARRLLEPLLIQLAIERATSEDIAALRSCLEPLRARAEGRSAVADVEADPGLADSMGDGPADTPHTTRHFHRTLSEAAHNNVLAAVINIVMELCRRQTNTDDFDPAHLLQVHAAITDAIEVRDAETATRLTLEHLQHSERQALARASTSASPAGTARDV